MAGVTSVGVGSGLDLENLLTNLVNAERTPVETRLAKQEAGIQADISAFGNLKSALSKLQTSLAGIRDAAGLSAQNATSSDTSLFSASARTGAAPGEFDVQVLNLARAQKLASGNFTSGAATVGSGTLTIATGSDSFDVDVAAGTTLAQLRDLINSAAGNSSVAASLVTVDDGAGGTVTRLLLSARNTGVDNAVGVTVSDDDATDTDASGLSRFFFASGNAASQLSQIVEARDARIAVNGFTASSSTNTFADVLDGVTITALREPEDPFNPETATLTVAQNRTTLSSRLQAFVSAYNEARTTIRDLTRYDQASGAAGPLLGDATVRNIDTGLRRVLTSVVDGPETFRTLSSVGVSVQRDGSLTLDQGKLNTALQSNFDDVVTLLSDEEQGIGARFAKVLDSTLDSSGPIRARADGFDKQLREIADQRDALALRIEAIESRYRKQFIALDQLVSRLQSSGDFLLAQLKNTASIITGNKDG